MRAMATASPAEPEALTFHDLPNLTPGAGEVLVEVHAIGINPADAYQVRGAFQIAPTSHPMIPGFDIAGVVAALGSGVVGWSVGDRVVGAIVYGAYAEQAVLPAEALARVPAAISLTIAASLPVAWGTAGVALDVRAQVRPGERVLVVGAAGAVGSAAVALAGLRGASVLATATDPHSVSHLVEGVCGHRDDNFVDQLGALAGKRGIDVVIDMIGGGAGATALHALAWSGRYVVIGAASGSLEPIEPFELLTGNKAAIGLDFSTYILRDPYRVSRLVEEVLATAVAGAIKLAEPGTARLEEAGRVLGEVARFERGKTVLLTDKGPL